MTGSENGDDATKNPSGNSDETSDFGETSSETLVESETVSEKEKLRFARQILLGVAILFAGSMVAQFFSAKIEIFEACKTILPPIATLVIGAYFGRK